MIGQYVWCAPRPGRFLAVMWFLENFGSPVFMAINYLHGGVSAMDRGVFVIDPAADARAAGSARAELDRVGRRARRRFAVSRLTHAGGLGLLVLALAAGVLAADASGFDVGVAMLIAVPGGFVMLAATIATDLFARRSVRELHDLDVPHAARSDALGRSGAALRQIVRGDQRSAGDQRLLVDDLWQVAAADQARSSYLRGLEFDENEFAQLRLAVERAEGGLEAWAGTGRGSPSAMNAR